MNARPVATRRVLVVAYNFPPVGGVGVLRTLKYVTYLPESGWEPLVLTARDPGARPWDEAALRALPPELRVERAFSPEPSKLRRGLGEVVRTVRRAAVGSPNASGASSSAGPGSISAGSAWTRLGELWRDYVRLAFFPDEQVGWVPFAVARGIQLHRERSFDAVYSSAGPFSSHLAAAEIARRTGLPWVADFRDPWVGNAFAPRLPAWQAYVQRRLERAMVARADRVTLVTEGMREHYARRYPWAGDKLTSIPNGYDRNDFGPEVRAAIERHAGSLSANGLGQPDAPRVDGKFKFVYAGSVYGADELRIFLEGVELLLRRQPELRDRIDIEFIGWLNQHNQAIAADYATPDRLAGVVHYSPFVPHLEALRRMVEADALFNVIADEPGKGVIQGGKLAEYVGLDRQVVAFVPEGEARRFLRELDWGIVEDPTPEGVAAGLARALVTPAPARPADPGGRYERTNLTRRLAAVLDEVAGFEASE